MMNDNKMEDVLTFLKEFSWVYDFQITKFFVEEVWKSFPSEWEDPLFGLSVAQLNDLPFGHMEDDWPDSLKTFVRKCTTYTLPREAVKMSKPVNIDQDIRRGISPKKEHEVRRMATAVHDIAQKAGCALICDIGSGLGYLGQVLHKEFGYDVIGFESQQSHTTGAEKRASNVRKDGIHNVTFQLENHKQSMEEFEKLIQGYLPDKTVQENDQLTRRETDHCDRDRCRTEDVCDRVCQQPAESADCQTIQNSFSVDDHSKSNEIANKSSRTPSLLCEKRNFESSSVTQKLDGTNMSNTCFHEDAPGNFSEEKHCTETGDPDYDDCNSCKIVRNFEKCRLTNGCHDDLETCMKYTSTDGSHGDCQLNVSTEMDKKALDTRCWLGARDSRSKPGAVMIGLHCCGDLTPTMLSFYSKINSVRALCCVSCCYHRMKYDDTTQSFDNFPLSNTLRTIYEKLRSSNNITMEMNNISNSEISHLSLNKTLHSANTEKCLHNELTDNSNETVSKNIDGESMADMESSDSGGCPWRLNVYSMRLAAQETRGRWKNQSEEDHQFHIKNVGYRGILELYVHKREVTCGKLFRKLVRKADFSSFTGYLEAACRRSDCATETHQNLNKLELLGLYDAFKEKFKYIEPFTVLQVMLQPLLESLVYKDRQLWLAEQGIKCDILPLFDETLSPRNLALMSVKEEFCQ